VERDPDKARLEDLDRRIRALGPAVPASRAKRERVSASEGAGTGTRVVTELLAGVLGGLLLGWFIDRQAGTGPWALLVCLGLGIAGAFNNVLKEARKPVGGAQTTRED